MKLYGIKQLTTVEESPFIQLRVNWFDTDIVPSTNNNNKNVVSSIVTVVVDGGLVSFTFEALEDSRMYKKTLSIYQKTAEHYTYTVSNGETSENYIVNPDSFYKVAKVEKETGNFLSIEDSGIFVILDVDAITTSVSYNIYMFNNIFPVYAKSFGSNINGSDLLDTSIDSTNSANVSTQVTIDKVASMPDVLWQVSGVTPQHKDANGIYTNTGDYEYGFPVYKNNAGYTLKADDYSGNRWVLSKDGKEIASSDDTYNGSPQGYYDNSIPENTGNVKVDKVEETTTVPDISTIYKILNTIVHPVTTTVVRFESASFSPAPSFVNPWKDIDAIRSVNGMPPIDNSFNITLDIDESLIEDSSDSGSGSDSDGGVDVDLPDFSKIPELPSKPENFFPELPFSPFNNPEKVKQDFGFDPTDFDPSVVWNYTTYDITQFLNNYPAYIKNIIDYPLDSYGPIPDNIDTTVIPHTRVSLYESMLENQKDRDWEDSSLGLMMTLNPGSRSFSVNRTNYIDTAPAGAGDYFELVPIYKQKINPSDNDNSGTDWDICCCDGATLTKDKKNSGPSIAYITKGNITKRFEVPYKLFKDAKRYVKKNVFLFVSLDAYAPTDDPETWEVNVCVISEFDLSDISGDSTVIRSKLLGTIIADDLNDNKPLISQEHRGTVWFDFDVPAKIPDGVNWAGNRYNRECTLRNEATYTLVPNDGYSFYRLDNAAISVLNTTYVRVNNVILHFTEDTWPIRIDKGTVVYVFVHVHLANADTTKATVEIQTSPYSLITDTNTDLYYLIGYVTCTDSSFYVTQLHTSGVPQLYWYLPCGYVPESDSGE
jgi:hypothetical protein